MRAKYAQELNKEPEEDKGEKNSLSRHAKLAMSYLAMLKALREYYHFSHWVSKMDPFYADHTLFQRLYQGLDEQIDGAAEKFIGLIGEETVYLPELTDTVNKIIQKAGVQKSEKISGSELARCAIKLENGFLSFSESMYDKLKEDDTLTLGLDDMLMANYNEHEDTLYLLKQRVKN